jgi:hypothetical protein
MTPMAAAATVPPARHTHSGVNTKALAHSVSAGAGGGHASRTRRR